VSSEAWKTSWIFQLGGSLILYATLDIWETTSKGPYLLGDNLGVILLGSRRFVPSNQTLDLTGNGEWCGRSLIQDSCALRCASWAAFLASSIAESRCSRDGMSVFLVGW